MDRIFREIKDCKICARAAVGLLVPGEGSVDARVVFVGEAPGKLEAATGRPFVGRSGQLLRSLINGLGLNESDVFITSAVKYLPSYITPKLKDIEHGRLHLDKQLRAINPEIVVLLGSVAARTVLREKYSLTNNHGQVIIRDGIKYFLAYHPAAPLHNPKLRTELEKDFIKLRSLLDGQNVS